MTTQQRASIFMLVAASALLGAFTAVADDGSLVSLDREVLVAKKERLLSDKPGALRLALNEVIARADKALALVPPAVTDKSSAPPSGDKHDYYSRGIYWWPHPSKEDGLPYVERDGQQNPEVTGGEFDRARLSLLVDAVDVLGVAYFYTENEAYAEKAALLLRTWFLSPATRMNPHLRYAQAVPGVSDGRCFGIIDFRGSVCLVRSVGLIRRSSAWSDDDQAGLVAWFREYLDWLRTSDFGIEASSRGNNHGTWYDVQVATLSLLVGQPDIAKEVLTESARQRIDTQIAADGSQPHELARTRSYDYSSMNLLAMMELARLGDQVGVDLWHYRGEDGAGIREATDYLLDNAVVEGPWPHQQILPVELRKCLPVALMAHRAYDDRRYDRIAAELRRVDPIEAAILLLTL